MLTYKHTSSLCRQSRFGEIANPGGRASGRSEEQTGNDADCFTAIGEIWIVQEQARDSGADLREIKDMPEDRFPAPHYIVEIFQFPDLEQLA